MFEKDFLGTGKSRTSVVVLTSKVLQLMSWFALMAAALLAVMSFTLKTAQASSATCYDITGETTGVLVGSTANSGVVHFENASYVPALQYQACVEDNNTPLGEGPFEVKGWAWDTNLGWISFYCGDENADGAPYENLGVPCGNEIYGVTMEGLVPTGGTASGQLRGYAWGDNAGWVNFSCVGGVDSLGNACGGFDYGVQAETTDTACYGEVYGSPAPGTCSDNLPEDTFIFAWSDSVGWFDFTGVQFPWIELIDAGVVVTAYLDPDPSVVGYTVPVADGSDAYKLRMVVTKTSGAAIVPEDYSFNITLDWPMDCIDLNQTDIAPPVCDAVSLPIDESDFNLTSAGAGGYGQDGVANAFTVNIPSFAPTSDQNGYTFSGGGYFPYETFVEGDPNGGIPIPVNDLQIGQLSVSVMRTSDSVCAFGDDYATCTQYPVTNFNGSPHLGFQPAVDIPTLDNQTTDADAIQAAYKIGQTIDYLTACRGTFSADCGSANVAFAMGVTTPEFLFVADFASGAPDSDATCADPTSFAIPTNLAWNTGIPVSFIITPVFQPDGSDPSGCKQTGPTSGEGAYLYSTVSYTNSGKAVSYYSNKLPRVTGTLVVNPVADVKGSVYSTGVTNPQEGTSVRSIGDVSTNILRDAIFRNVSNIVAGADEPSGDGTIVDDGLASTVWTVDNGTTLYPDLGGVPRVYYFTGDVALSSSATNITWGNQRTIVSVGGDVYIDSNLYNDPSSLPVGASKPRLGIIALKDLNTGNGGNVYISSDVNDIQANIFADGSVFSYDGNPANINSAGEPCWASEKVRHDTLINQLYIEGSIASQNTIGGAADVTPTLGNGKKVSAAEGTYGGSGSLCLPTGRSQARLYDLNFMRYYGLVYERLDAASACPGQAKDQQFPLACPGEPGYAISATQVSAGGDLVLPDVSMATVSQYLATQVGDHLNAVYVYFDPPPSTLPGFGVTGGVDMTVRPR